MQPLKVQHFPVLKKCITILSHVCDSLLLTTIKYVDHQRICCECIDFQACSPSFGVVDEMVATGPVPVFVMALILKVYEVKGFRQGTLTEVAFGSSTVMSCLESGPTTCTQYPVMIVLCRSFRRGIQEISAVVGSLQLTLNPSGGPCAKRAAGMHVNNYNKEYYGVGIHTY